MDKNLLNKINDSIRANSNDLIIEIGPGMGALTSKLKTKRANIICYEIDTDMIPYLSKLEDKKTKIIYKATKYIIFYFSVKVNCEFL